MSSNIIKSLPNILGLEVARRSTFLRQSEALHQLTLDYERITGMIERVKQNLELFLDLNNSELIPLVFESQSQLWQDLFVLHELKFKTDGYFVEFGAADGISLSNSYLLEKRFGWKGILAEPSTLWHSALRENRNAMIDTRCVWSQTGSVLEFTETQVPELSTISSFVSSDFHANARKSRSTYTVNTVSLNDMLKEHRAPRAIDYLSIDTEGSEFEILSNFDFQQYEIKIITCEHNFAPDRDRIHSLMRSHGYKRKFVNHSRFDWYVLAN